MGYYIFVATFIPFQGFFNFVIYFRPKFAAIQQREGLAFGRTILRVLRLNVARKEPVSELESPGDGKNKRNKMPEVGCQIENPQAIAEKGAKQEAAKGIKMLQPRRIEV